MRHYGQQLNNCNLYAPNDGFVVYAPGNRGDPIRDGAILRERQKVMTVHDVTQLQIRTRGDAPGADRVKAGMTASIELVQSSGKQLNGSVIAVQQQGGKTEAIISISGNNSLRPGATAAVTILLDERRDVVLIPLSALTSRGGQTYCYVVTEGGIEQRPLTLGATGDQHAEVVGGLKPREDVVLHADSIDIDVLSAGQ